MNRRRFLHGITATCAIPLTGCLADDGAGPGVANGTDDPTATDTPAPTAEPPEESDSDSPADGTETGDVAEDTVSGTDRPDGTPSDTADESPDDDPQTTAGGAGESDSSFDVTDTGCGGQTDDASVSFDDSSGSVSVTGTIWANDLTYTATLASTSVEDGELTVVVATERRSETAVGGQCINEIDYEATVPVDGDLPVSVVVRHRRGDTTTTVTDVTR